MAIPLFYHSFAQGLNTKSAPYLLDEGLGALPARDLLNVQGVVEGAILKRTGLVTFASPSNVFTSLFPLESVSPVVLVGADATNLYSVSTGGTVTSIASGLSNKRWAFASAPVVSGRGPLYAMNGTDAPQTWAGSGAAANWTATFGSVPNGTMVAYQNNQMFVAGVSTNPSTVYFSGVSDPTDWSAANLKGAGSMDFDPNDGQAITAIGVIGPYVFVAKPRKCWVITNPATAAFRKLSNNIGCVAPRSVATGPDGLFFLSEDRGVFVTNGSKLTPLSDVIQPTIDSVTGARKPLAAGVYYSGHYYLSVARNGATNDTTLDFDTVLKSWWMHSIPSNQFAVWHPASGAELYSAKASSAVVDKCFVSGVYSDNGAAMPWVWRGPWQSPSFYRRRLFPTPYYKKRLRQVRVDGYGTVDFSLAKDFAGRETLWQSNVFSGPGGDTTFGAADGSVFGASDGTVFGSSAVQRKKFFSLGVANAFSMVFGSTSSTPDAVYSYLMILHDRKDLVTT